MAPIHSPSKPLNLNAVSLAHLLLQNHVRPGDWVVDATAGNGHDTVVLANLTGPDGHVLAFEIQEPALQRTAERLEAEGIPPDRYSLFLAGHELLQERLREVPADRLRAILFNLGYCPGEDKELTTRSATTLTAVEAAMTCLAMDGLLVVVAYPGHPEGAMEWDGLRKFFESSGAASWQVVEMNPVQTSRPAPVVFAGMRKRPTQGKDHPERSRPLRDEALTFEK